MHSVSAIALLSILNYICKNIILEDKIKSYITIGLAFLTICSGTWQLAYWTTFNINIYAYLDISDILLSSIYPLITSFSVFIIFNLRDMKTFSNMPLFGGEIPDDEPRRKRIYRLIWQYGAIVTLVTLWTFSARTFYDLLPILGFIAISSSLFSNLTFREKIKSFSISTALINTIIVIFLFTIAQAKSKSYKAIYENKKVDLIMEKDSLIGNRLLGETNKYIFTAKSDSVYIIVEKAKCQYIKIY